MIYRSIVRRNVRRVFDALNRGDATPLVDGLVDDATYRFHGDHALGGRRTSRAGIERWCQRLFRLLPGLQFDVTDIVVNGWPHHTTVMTRADITGTADGQPYANTMMQRLTLRWGKVVSIETLEDTAVLAATLDRLERAGVDEAGAAALTG